MLAQKEKPYYSELKQFITNTLKLPCQALLKKTMQSKNRLTICGKILLQINAKIGQALSPDTFENGTRTVAADKPLANRLFPNLP